MAENNTRENNTLSLEPKVLIAVRARRRFKAIVRLVIANLFWLEDIGHAAIGDNVMNNVRLITHRKSKKGQISPQEKIILVKRLEDRTTEEQKHLMRVIGSLKCFRGYPEHVKEQLASSTFYEYFGPGRVIIRQDHKPQGMYFILSGECTISKTILDPILNEYITIDLGNLVAGNMFGEVSLLHDIKRTATITTATRCELLRVKKDDFNRVLKQTVLEQWDSIKAAMKRFSYFDGWDEVSVREFCILAKIKSFVPDETLLGSGEGLPSYTYFLIKGKCKMIENLLVQPYCKNGFRYYQLYEPPIEKILEKYESEEHMIMNSNSYLAPKNTKSSIDPTSSESIREQCRSKSMGSEGTQTVVLKTYSRVKKFLKDPSYTSSMNISLIPKDVETHFIQVCTYNELSCFNIGENLKHRAIVAISPVEVIMVPRYWLIRHNKGNIWNKIQQFLDLTIPTTEKLFSFFFEQRKWNNYKKKYLADAYRAIGKIPFKNSVNNIPYSIRINNK